MTEPDLAEFVALSKPRRLECGMRRVLRELAPADRRKLEAALAADDIRHTAISRWLANRNVKLAADTVKRHRKRECSCDE